MIKDFIGRLQMLSQDSSAPLSCGKPEPVLKALVRIPAAFCVSETLDGGMANYAGDIRVGDLRGTGALDFLVYRSTGNAHDGGGMKPCFLGAFTAEGEELWSVGEGGLQPCRPGPVALRDIDGDGRAEVICFFHDGSTGTDATSMGDVVIQIRDGATGELRKQAAPEALRACSGRGPNWCHQRLFFADFCGNGAARDFVVKLGPRILAFNADLELLWLYESPWAEYQHCPAYIPSVGDLDGDGRDEVNGGYFLLDHDGTVLWERDIAPNMDSVAIAPWDGGRMRALCSGHGIVLDEAGQVLQNLGDEFVPHGQEMRAARFYEEDADPQMVIRYDGHKTGVIVVNTAGQVIQRFDLNDSPNNTGMEQIYWQGRSRPALLANGGMIWDIPTGAGVRFPELPLPSPKARMSWYHCIPVLRKDNDAEDVVLYNPWDRRIWIYTFSPSDSSTKYVENPRQYNARIMD